MSMLQAQCDELRSMAESVGLAMPQAATLMMEAADTIDRLDLALDSKRIAERRVTELLDENAKLRELCKDMWNWLAPTAVGGGAPLKGLYDRMRELGVEP